MNYLSRAGRRVCITIRKANWRLFNKNLHFGAHFNFRKRLEINCAQHGVINIGSNVFFNNDCSLNAHRLIEIGDDCIFGEAVKIYDHNHKFFLSNEKIRQQGFSESAVAIGDDCWIGSNVVILAGTCIGNHVVIGAGCIVSGTIPSNVVLKASQNYNIEQIRSI
ncbi:acyltransferase [Bifidobacterium animalis]|uniref:acyltransferase n=1 Tax=Bifidobacterium animalis TaxID=28025 RepID=UPI0009BA97E1|nr:acyltransferase [Bifidobacterium animalis]